MKLLTSFVQTSKNLLRATGSSLRQDSDGQWCQHHRFKGLVNASVCLPIAKYTEGTYHVVNLTADSDESLNEFDRLAKFSDDILRHMIVKREA